jgi:1-acyl-sn-glycerol-3-phosphate acyltransferase
MTATNPATPMTTGRSAAGGRPTPPRPVDRATFVWKWVQLTARLISTIYFDMKVYGVRNVPRTGGVLIVSNHQSLLDPPLLGTRLHRPMSYMAKAELFDKNKFFTWMIRSLGAFPVRQGAGDVGAIRETVSRLQEGRMLNIFPEGSRTVDGEILPMQPGVALVVRRAGVPVIPTAIDGSYEAWPKGAKMFRRRQIRIVYGPPLDVTGMKGDQIIALIDRSIRTLYDRLRTGQMNDTLAAEPLR